MIALRYLIYGLGWPIQCYKMTHDQDLDVCTMYMGIRMDNIILNVPTIQCSKIYLLTFMLKRVRVLFVVGRTRHGWFDEEI